MPVIPAYKISGDAEPSDYINASFIADMFNGEQKKYIAAQGPGTDTTPAFWQMIWQYGVQVVVMLTSLVEGVGADRVQCVKCNKYWPDNVGDSKKFGDIQVQLFDKAEVIFFWKKTRWEWQFLMCHYVVLCPCIDIFYFLYLFCKYCTFRLQIIVWGSWMLQK